MRAAMRIGASLGLAVAVCALAACGTVVSKPPTVGVDAAVADGADAAGADGTDAAGADGADAAGADGAAPDAAPADTLAADSEADAIAADVVNGDALVPDAAPDESTTPDMEAEDAVAEDVVAEEDAAQPDDAADTAQDADDIAADSEACELQAESCNGKDDNCNGSTDEGADAACDDGNGCTADGCTAGKCVHVKIASCGDGLCAAGCGESYGNCPQDCKEISCGNGVCEVADGGAAGCAADCGAACGDCKCEGDETAKSCPTDCGSCGDGTCSVCGASGEAAGCPMDCGAVALSECTLAWVDFCNDGSACTTDACALDKGCVHKPAAGKCSDGSVCTVGDHCEGGACAPGTPLGCDDGNGCTADSCAPQKGCLHADSVGTACSDGDACTLGDACQGGACLPGAAKACDDGNVCTDDACDKGACIGLANGASCTDGNDCTDEGCAQGQCAALPNDVSCNDGNACTLGDVCQSGACAGSGVQGCDDGNGCTADSCESVSGCVHLPMDGTACSDGDACTLGDKCAGDQCTSGSAKDCDDGNVCTDDACSGGACGHAPNSGPCATGDVCSAGEVCGGGSCASTGPKDCSDGTLCTTDFCGAGTGCGHAAVDCDDSNVCTTDSCDAGSGCVHAPVEAGLVCGGSKLCNGKGACLAPVVYAGMVFEPAATFWMGCNAVKDFGCAADEKPQHKVTLSPFYLDETETTVAQYKACVDAGACTAPNSVQPATWATYPGLTDHPVNYVNWAQAQKFCQWRGPEYDLPTEAQWERAARGACEDNGSTAADPACAAAMRKFPWGEAAATCSLAAFQGCNKPDATSAVNTKPAGDSVDGAHDLAGNVDEWTRDGYFAYQAGDQTDPSFGAAAYRVARGGDFYSTANLLRAGARTKYDPAKTSFATLGFRCVRTFP